MSDGTCKREGGEALDTYKTDKAKWLEEVCRLLQEGLSNDAIAKHYGISTSNLWSRLSRSGQSVKTVWCKRTLITAKKEKGR